MNTLSTCGERARERMASFRGEPLFCADWARTVFLHYEADPTALQESVPYCLDLHEGRAYVSLVAFTLSGLRPHFGGRLGAALFRPIATHEFLNARAYVRHHGEPGIFFLAEWLSNRLSVKLGPMSFGLPYRFGQLDYRHHHEHGELRGRVEAGAGGGALDYRATVNPTAKFAPCSPGTLDEFLLERYTAFTQWKSTHRFFRIWHDPWPQTPIEVSLADRSLLTVNWPWFREARLVGANYSPGVRGVWMGRPHRTDPWRTPARSGPLTTFLEFP